MTDSIARSNTPPDGGATWNVVLAAPSDLGGEIVILEPHLPGHYPEGRFFWSHRDNRNGTIKAHGPYKTMPLALYAALKYEQ